MKLLITGVSHKTAPVEIRERLAFSEATLPPALPVARVDAYIESGGAFTTPAPEEV